MYVYHISEKYIFKIISIYIFFKFSIEINVRDFYGIFNLGGGKVEYYLFPLL